MFSTICFIFSIICFISGFGCHMAEVNEDSDALYLSSPLWSAIPWVSGFILAVIPECLVFNIAWYWMFLINLIGVYILGPIITKQYLIRLASGKGHGFDAFVALIIGIVTLLLGLIFRS